MNGCQAMLGMLVEPRGTYFLGMVDRMLKNVVLSFGLCSIAILCACPGPEEEKFDVNAVNLSQFLPYSSIDWDKEACPRLVYSAAQGEQLTYSEQTTVQSTKEVSVGNLDNFVKTNQLSNEEYRQLWIRIIDSVKGDRVWIPNGQRVHYKAQEGETNFADLLRLAKARGKGVLTSECKPSLFFDALASEFKLEIVADNSPKPDPDPAPEEEDEDETEDDPPCPPEDPKPSNATGAGSTSRQSSTDSSNAGSATSCTACGPSPNPAKVAKNGTACAGYSAANISSCSN